MTIISVNNLIHTCFLKKKKKNLESSIYIILYTIYHIISYHIILYIIKVGLRRHGCAM